MLEMQMIILTAIFLNLKYYINSKAISNIPKTLHSLEYSKLIKVNSNIVTASALASSIVFANTVNGNAAEISSKTSNLLLDSNAYISISDSLKICRVLNGLWQVSGAHGYSPDRSQVVDSMSKYINEGFTTFDLADIYGPAEDFVGSFTKESGQKNCQFLTKWVPRPQDITKQKVNDAIDRSLYRMNQNKLDLLQFHWWDYNNDNYYKAVNYLAENDKISNLGLTNFDTDHMVDLIKKGAPLISNQVSFSILDTRPNQFMLSACKQYNVKLLCYGVLLGGFLSNKWIGQPEPLPEQLSNVSLRKYLPWIQLWGGWELFQELLKRLLVIANKHSVSVSNVAMKWVLDQPQVGGVIIGARLGFKQHIQDNKEVFNFALDDTDYSSIEEIQKRSNNLMKYFGDCGGEYRRRY